jgi:hypothetical protein
LLVLSLGLFSGVLSSVSFPAHNVTVGDHTVPVTNFSPSQLVLNIGNHAPTISAGSAVLNQGAALTLHATGSDPDGDGLTFSWDINGDGVFGDLTGASPTISWADLTRLRLTSGSGFTVRVMADDGHGHVTTSAPAEVTINPTPVRVLILGANTTNEGAPYTLHLASYLGAGHNIGQWSINWGDGTANTVVPGSTTRVQHTYATGPNHYTISATATDDLATYAANNTLAITAV